MAYTPVRGLMSKATHRTDGGGGAKEIGLGDEGIRDDCTVEGASETHRRFLSWSMGELGKAVIPSA